MFTRKFDAEYELTEVIDSLARNLREAGTENSDKYDQYETRLENAIALRRSLRESRMSPDTRASLLGNLAGILLILNHERVHVVSSKALSFVMKTR